MELDVKMEFIPPKEDLVLTLQENFSSDKKQNFFVLLVAKEPMDRQTLKQRLKEASMVVERVVLILMITMDLERAVVPQTLDTLMAHGMMQIVC